MTSDPHLREHQVTVDCYLEHAPRTLDQPYLCVRVFPLDLSHQTGGARFVVSDAAVLDADLHVTSADPSPPFDGPKGTPLFEHIQH